MGTYSVAPFKEALADLLRNQQGDPMRVNLKEFTDKVEGYAYHSLLGMIEGRRTLQPGALEAMAKVLRVPPDYFIEYRVHWTHEFMMRNPEAADQLYELAKSLDALSG